MTELYVGDDSDNDEVVGFGLDVVIDAMGNVVGRELG